MEATKINIDITVSTLRGMKSVIAEIQSVVAKNPGIDFSVKINVGTSQV